MRVISIASSDPAQSEISECGDENGAVPKLNLPLARRDFLRGTGILFGTIATGTVLSALAPSPVWALELKRLTTAEGQTLMAFGRVLYPHKKLPDAVYALLVKDLDAKAAADASLATQLSDGIKALDTASGSSFDKTSATHKLEVVKAIEGSAFFATVRGQCVTSLYDNDMAFAVFGYPGSAWEKGGYITRGFQDLKWLPAPSLAASPRPYVG